MLTTVKGYFEEGQIMLEETPPYSTKTTVIVTFLPEEKKEETKKVRLGSLAGRITVPDDFDEPLEDFNEYL